MRLKEREYGQLLLGIPLLLFIISFFIIISCKKNNDICNPVALYEIIPKNGNTVTKFIFDALKTTIECEDEDILFRWDFEGDGIWDLPFSQNNKITHRYYLKGTYYPILEVKHLSGITDTISMKINVEQGNSPPWPSLIVDQYRGNKKTVFSFDASGTKDDEDSVSLLKYRWDWENDETWDTDFSSEPYNSHMYQDTGIYLAIVEAKDTSGLTAQMSRKLSVDLFNYSLFVDIKISPDSGTSRDTFSFDASPCFDLENVTKDFQYSWTIYDDDNVEHYNSIETSNSVINYKFKFHEFGKKRITLTIHDKDGLINSITKKFSVHYDNKPPVADCFAAPKRGNINTQFYYNCEKLCTDPDEAWWELYYRWDFDNDGNWDTKFSRYNREVNYQYSSPGEYLAILEVMDSGGLTDTAEVSLIVSNGTNETGILIHEYGNPEDFQMLYYGTVKIGDQWWMSENLDIDDEVFLTSPRVINNMKCYQNCFDFNHNFAEGYQNQDIYRQTYGGLYRILDLIVLRIANDYPLLAQCRKDMYGNPIVCDKIVARICPDNWHISTPEDWDQLIDYLGPNAAEELKPGGSTDFNALYGGEGLYSQSLGRAVFLGLEEYAAFATFNLEWVKTGDISLTQVYQINKNSHEIEINTYSTFSRYSVRCIKNN